MTEETPYEFKKRIGRINRGEGYEPPPGPACEHTWRVSGFDPGYQVCSLCGDTRLWRGRIMDKYPPVIRAKLRRD